MPTGDDPFAPNRRALLRAAILLVGGTAMPAFAAWDAASGDPAPFFTPAERGTLDLLCETLIPQTDTPGAVAAGVPAFLDRLMATWASPAHAASMRATVAGLGRVAQAETGRPLAALSPAERTAWLARQDAALLAARDAGYALFKRLAMTGYYYSEAGATQELRYELVPGRWDPKVPVTADTRSWAA